MKAIVLPRQGGKTQRLLRWLILDERRILIVMSMRERDRLLRLFVDLPKLGRRIVTLDMILRGATRGMWPDPIYGIDEVDQVLAQLLRGPVEVVSFSGEVETPVLHGPIGVPS